MDPNNIHIDDDVSESPVGPGKVTGITEAGYPQVNNVAVACLKRADGAVFDPYGHMGGSRGPDPVRCLDPACKETHSCMRRNCMFPDAGE
jgi:hypothetical protein